MTEEEMAAWVRIAKVCAALAVLALVFNLSLPWEMTGHLRGYSLVRKTITKVFSAGTTWAAVAAYAGWEIRRPWRSMAAGVLAAEATMALHYGLGMLVGAFDSTAFSSNVVWFVAGVVLCGPLGLVGWLASRAGWFGLLARLVVPMGAVAEPFTLHSFSMASMLPWPERYSSIASGAMLEVVGMALVGLVLARGPRWTGPRRRPDHASPPAVGVSPHAFGEVG